MQEHILAGKKMLIMDDEADVLETLEEMPATCIIDKARNFETGKKLLKRNIHDVAILDIMGVRGYEFLRVADPEGIPALMLTAHALSPDNLIQAIKEGAQSYVAKDKLSVLPSIMSDVLGTSHKVSEKKGVLVLEGQTFFDKCLGRGLQGKDNEL